MDRKVLLLNASEEVISMVSWTKAVTLFTSGKANGPYNYEDEYEIKTTSGIFKLPSALILSKYVRIPFNKISLNRSNLLKRDKFKCGYCGCSLTQHSGTIDHILPISRKGTTTWNNVVSSCRKCNHKKADKTPDEAGMKLHIKPFVPSKEMLIVNTIDIAYKQKWKRWIN